MKNVRPLLLALTLIALLPACADILSSLRQESAAIDEEAERDRDPSEARVAEEPRVVRPLRGLSANNVPEFEPPAAREYRRKLGTRLADPSDSSADVFSNERRATRDDFVDKVAHENSLWDGQGQTNYLFANNRRRESGDMLTAEVEKELRREIQYQLWLSLPPEQRKVRRPASAATDALTNAAGAPAKDAMAAAGEKSQETKNKDAAEEAAKTNLAPVSKEDDVIRMEVVENLGNGLVRVLGQKRVVYKGVTRLVEVAALVNNKDVDDANRVKSSNFLDMKAQVIQ